jgi:hypothetical protein
LARAVKQSYWEFQQRVHARERAELAEANARHDAVRPRLSGLLLQVFDHHRPAGRSIGMRCEGCDPSYGYQDDEAAWPCSTWQMIADGSA